MILNSYPKILYMIFAIGFSNALAAFAQTDKCGLDLLFRNERIQFIRADELRIGETIKVLTNKETYYLCKIISCKGDLTFMEYTFDSILISTGEFKNPFDTIKTLCALTSSNQIILKYVVECYFQPIRHGKWVFYNLDGSILKEENFVDGVLKKQ